MNLSKQEIKLIIQEEINNVVNEINIKMPDIIDIDGVEKPYDETYEGKQRQYDKSIRDAITGFQRYYRKLDSDQRYEIQVWLRSKLIKDINLSEVENIVSRVIAATDGLSRRKDPQMKPK